MLNTNKEIDHPQVGGKFGDGEKSESLGNNLVGLLKSFNWKAKEDQV